MAKILEAKILEPNEITITEYNADKSPLKYPRIYEFTQYTVKDAINSGKSDLIPPIVAIKNPFKSKESIRAAYQASRNHFAFIYEDFYKKYEPEILESLLDENLLLCYNGNRRLEEFQKANHSIAAYVITNPEEFEQIPKKEIVPRFEEVAGKNYYSTFMFLLHRLVSDKSRQRHYEQIFKKLKDENWREEK